MKTVAFPEGFVIESLRKGHARREFCSGERRVDDWRATKALQHQQKHLSATKVLLARNGAIAGYYTLATGQVDFSDLPAELSKHLPRRTLPVAMLAWLGISAEYQGQGFGKRLLAQALRDCYEAQRTFPFVAVILDCINESVKSFYSSRDFEDLPGYSNRMFLSAQRLCDIIEQS